MCPIIVSVTWKHILAILPLMHECRGWNTFFSVIGCKDGAGAAVLRSLGLPMQIR